MITIIRMRKIYLLLATIFVAGLAQAQLTGTKNIPGDYPDLNAAITDLNVQGVGAGGVIFNVLPGNAQTAPAGGYVIGGAGSNILITGTFPTSLANNVQINGNGNTVTASAALTVGSLTDAIFKLVGADYIGIQGFVMIENPLNTVNTPAASNTMTEWGIALLYVSTTDGSQNNAFASNSICRIKASPRKYPFSRARRNTGPTSINPALTASSIGAAPGRWISPSDSASTASVMNADSNKAVGRCRSSTPASAINGPLSATMHCIELIQFLPDFVGIVADSGHFPHGAGLQEFGQ